MSFLAGSFLFALAAAAGPTVIHLLNRRRFRTVEWAAMDFLRQAVKRNKRVLELRDLILLLLRTLAVILFVLAMAQPYWKSSETASFRGQPVHAVIVLDNSLSMGFSQLDKTLLDAGKEKAAAFINTLPKGSQVSLVPLCDQDQWHTKDVYHTQEDALEALGRITLVDRPGFVGVGADAARRAINQASHIPTKRVVFISDLQARTWRANDLAQDLAGLGPVQIVNAGPPSEQRANTWVSEFRLRDGITDAGSPAVFDVTIRHEGEQPRQGVRVSLKIDGVDVDGRTIDLLPGQTLHLIFKHRFDVAGTSAEPLFVPATLQITSDRLALDDRRMIIVPIAARVPVLCVDNLGENERPELGRYGETYLLRRLLAPRTSRDENDKSLVEVRRRSLATVTREDFADARLAVVAGVASPTTELARLMREYVEQGGQLIIAAGGEFDPVAWNSLAWMQGAGVLPAPLAPNPAGELPGRAMGEDWPRFRLAPDTLSDGAFDLRLSDEERDDLFTAPFFYKAVALDTEALSSFDEVTRQRLREKRQQVRRHAQAERRWADLERAGQLTPQEAAQRDEARLALEQVEPSWLAWSNTLTLDDADLTVDQLVARTRPRVMAQYDNGHAFAARRHIGKGQVVFFTSGLYPTWNNMMLQPAVILYDRVMRSMLTRSLPSRTLDPMNQITIPVRSRDLGARFTVRTPDDPQPHDIEVEALGENSYGLILRSLGGRGVYAIERQGAGETAAGAANVNGVDTTTHKGWRLLLAMNGPSEESELGAASRGELDPVLADAGVEARWVAADGQITLEGAAFFGLNTWVWLMLAALACLAAEMVFLAQGSRSRVAGANAVRQ